MDTLLTVSACQGLAPWVTELTLGFYSAPAYMRGDVYARSVARQLSLDGREGLHRICAAERSLWPGMRFWNGKSRLNYDKSCTIYEWNNSNQLDSAADRLLGLVVQSFKEHLNMATRTANSKIQTYITTVSQEYQFRF